jgi:hypothetical protein
MYAPCARMGEGEGMGEGFYAASARMGAGAVASAYARALRAQYARTWRVHRYKHSAYIGTSTART